ncbi:MAG: hypothetical protein BroJett014_11520 [Planctomycetota bacterium]|nr:hypothetical protein [Planctomycetota bacterium]GIK52179.1 MAG: hypothetical protein BroJett014_11520 [Planctomycetota bacterium]
MPRGSPELVNAKIDYVRELVGADQTLLMFAVAKKVKEKFNESLAPDKLRAAFVEAGGTVGKPGQRAKSPGESAKTTQQAEPKPQRRKSGRRRADKAAAKARVALENLGKHIVVIRNGDAPEVKEFTSPDKAREFLQAKLSAGVPASALGFYSREPLEITVGI